DRRQAKHDQRKSTRSHCPPPRAGERVAAPTVPGRAILRVLESIIGSPAPDSLQNLSEAAAAQARHAEKHQSSLPSPPDSPWVAQPSTAARTGPLFQGHAAARKAGASSVSSAIPGCA